MVARPGADHQERQAVLGSDPGHQRLGPIAPATPGKSAPSATACRARAATSTIRALQQRHLGAQRLCLLLQPELGDLPPPDLGSMIRNGRRGRAAGPPGMAASWPPVPSATARLPAASTVSATATTATHSKLARPKRHQDDHRRRDHQDQRDPPEHTAVGKEPVRARQDRAHADHGNRHQRQAAPPSHSQQQRHCGEHQGKRAAGEPAPGHHIHQVLPHNEIRHAAKHEN